MATKQRTLKVVITGDSAELEAAIKKAGGSVEAFEKKTTSTSTKVAAGVATAFAADRVISFGGDMLALGNKLDTIGKKSKTVFEDQTDSVRQWAKSNASAFGQTDDTLVGLAANFGDLLKPMGFTADQAADMSTKVVGLSGALSAWSGGTKSAAEVSEILAKAMLGERDGLKELGISISEADVQRKLAEKGQEKLTGAALEQAKALATQELIFEKSADAQKAWADGSFDALKKQNALKERVAELKEQLAARLLPAFQAVAGFITDKVIPAVSHISEWISKHKGLVIAAAVGITAALVPAFIAWATAAGSAAIATIAAAAPVIAIGVAVAALAAGVIYAYQHWGWFRTAVDKVGEALGWVWENVLKPVGEWIANTLVPWVRDKLIPAFGDFGKKIGEMGQTLAEWVTKVWSAGGEVIKFFRELPGKIGDFFSGLGETLLSPFKWAFNEIAKFWNKTVGQLSFRAPDWIPGLGGKGWDVPDLPTFHSGGTFRAPSPGGVGLALLRDGERVSTPGSAGSTGGGAVIHLELGGTRFGTLVLSEIELAAARQGGIRAKALIG